MIDWIRFLRDHNIEYVEKGRNVKKGHVNVRCPFCGMDDPSEHMGISLTVPVFGCWRSASHAGKKPYNLIRALLGCSMGQARLIEQQYSAADPESFEDLTGVLAGDEGAIVVKPRRATTLRMPGDFRPVRNEGSTRRFFHYLTTRNFDTGSDIHDVVREYNLKCCTTGTWQDRIIFPIYMDGQLVSWTGRAIMAPIDAPRYRVLGNEEGALVDRNDAIYNMDNAYLGGEVLFVLEGPIDVIKVDFYCAEDNVAAVCPLGTRMSSIQAAIIGDISRHFKRRVLLYDPQEVETVFLTQDLLAPYNFEIGETPDWVTDDVGALGRRDVRRLVRRFL